jgi:hypothetical protein
MHGQNHPIRHFTRMAAFATALKSLPAQVLEHRYSYESFGSWWVTVQYRGISFRVILDGKESQLSVQRSASRKPPHLWADVIWQAPSVDADSDLAGVVEVIRSGAKAG